MPLKECYSCPYARWISVEDGTEPKLECDPPMGDCPAELERQADHDYCVAHDC